MNYKHEPAQDYSPRLLTIITAGIAAGYYNEPWREYSRDEPTQSNYEQARLLGHELRWRGDALPVKITPEWLQKKILELKAFDAAYDLCGFAPPFKRPPHLVTQDLNNALIARGLAALSTPQIEVY